MVRIPNTHVRSYGDAAKITKNAKDINSRATKLVTKVTHTQKLIEIDSKGVWEHKGGKRVNLLKNVKSWSKRQTLKREAQKIANMTGKGGVVAVEEEQKVGFENPFYDVKTEVSAHRGEIEASRSKVDNPSYKPPKGMSDEGLQNMRASLDTLSEVCQEFEDGVGQAEQLMKEGFVEHAMDHYTDVMRTVYPRYLKAHQEAYQMRQLFPEGGAPLNLKNFSPAVGEGNRFGGVLEGVSAELGHSKASWEDMATVSATLAKDGYAGAETLEDRFGSFTGDLVDYHNGEIATSLNAFSSTATSGELGRLGVSTESESNIRDNFEALKQAQAELNESLEKVEKKFDEGNTVEAMEEYAQVMAEEFPAYQEALAAVQEDQRALRTLGLSKDSPLLTNLDRVDFYRAAYVDTLDAVTAHEAFNGRPLSKATMRFVEEGSVFLNKSGRSDADIFMQKSQRILQAWNDESMRPLLKQEGWSESQIKRLNALYNGYADAIRPLNTLRRAHAMAPDNPKIAAKLQKATKMQQAAFTRLTTRFNKLGGLAKLDSFERAIESRRAELRQNLSELTKRDLSEHDDAEITLADFPKNQREAAASLLKSLRNLSEYHVRDDLQARARLPAQLMRATNLSLAWRPDVFSRAGVEKGKGYDALYSAYMKAAEPVLLVSQALDVDPGNPKLQAKLRRVYKKHIGAINKAAGRMKAQGWEAKAAKARGKLEQERLQIAEREDFDGVRTREKLDEAIEAFDQFNTYDKKLEELSRATRHGFIGAPNFMQSVFSKLKSWIKFSPTKEPNIFDSQVVAFDRMGELLLKYRNSDVDDRGAYEIRQINETFRKDVLLAGLKQANTMSVKGRRGEEAKALLGAYDYETIVEARVAAFGRLAKRAGSGE